MIVGGDVFSTPARTRAERLLAAPSRRPLTTIAIRFSELCIGTSKMTS